MNDKRSVFQQSFSEKKSNFISLSWEVKTVQSDFDHPKELRTQSVSNSQHLYQGNIGLLLLPDHQISLFGVFKYNHVSAMSQGRILLHSLQIHCNITSNMMGQVWQGFIQCFCFI